MTSFARNIALDQEWIRRKLSAAHAVDRKIIPHLFRKSSQPTESRLRARIRHQLSRSAVLNPSMVSCVPETDARKKLRPRPRHEHGEISPRGPLHNRLWGFRGFDFPIFDCAKNPPNHRRPHSMPQTTTKMVCNHHFRLSISSPYVAWPVSLHYEPLTPLTDENRLSALVIGPPRPPRRLQSERKVTTQSSKWEIAHL